MRIILIGTALGLTGGIYAQQNAPAASPGATQATPAAQPNARQTAEPKPVNVYNNISPSVVTPKPDPPSLAVPVITAIGSGVGSLIGASAVLLGIGLSSKKQREAEERKIAADLKAEQRERAAALEVERRTRQIQHHESRREVLAELSGKMLAFGALINDVSTKTEAISMMKSDHPNLIPLRQQVVADMTRIMIDTGELVRLAEKYGSRPNHSDMNTETLGYPVQIICHGTGHEAVSHSRRWSPEVPGTVCDAMVNDFRGLASYEADRIKELIEGREVITAKGNYLFMRDAGEAFESYGVNATGPRKPGRIRRYVLKPKHRGSWRQRPS